MHLDPARKHDFAFLFDVRHGNPDALGSSELPVTGIVFPPRFG